MRRGLRWVGGWLLLKVMWVVAWPERLRLRWTNWRAGRGWTDR